GIRTGEKHVRRLQCERVAKKRLDREQQVVGLNAAFRRSGRPTGVDQCRGFVRRRVQNWRISGVPVYFRPETSISGKQSATASPDDGVNVRITGEQMPRRLERIPIAVVDHDGLRLSTVEPLGQ